MRFLQLRAPRPLPEWLVEEGLTVKLVTRSEQHIIPGDLGALRFSPIHPLMETTLIPELEYGGWYIHFLVVRDAFSVLGRIHEGAYPLIQRHTWFGIGLASIIVFLNNSADIARLVEDRQTELAAHEVWRIDSGRLLHKALLLEPKPIEAGKPLVLPPLPESFPVDLTGIVEEFVASFRDAFRWACSYSPDEAPLLEILFQEVTELVSELLWLHGSKDSTPPDGLVEYNLSNPLECARLVQQRSDRVVQINSALSYVISQSCFGAPPVITEPALIRRHSLLGVGRAHRAVVNLVREIEKAFHNISIPTSIAEKWGSFPALPGFESAKQFDSTGWSNSNLPDVLVTRGAASDSSKLVYFSGRLGFRESEYSVSAAIDSLTSGDAPEWHLSTMTHEMLHAHVRDLIHVIFDRVRPDDGQKIDEFRKRLFDRFRKHMDGAADDMTLIDSVRSVLLSYCCLGECPVDRRK